MAELRQVREQGRFTRASSTCISNINYYPVEERMQITFHNPQIGTWEYFDVPGAEVAGLLTSSSQGQYFNLYIKGRYEYRKVG